MIGERGEELIQRFVDDELTRDERTELLDLVAQDDALRARLRSMERLVGAAKMLPAVTVPPGLVARALERLPGPKTTPRTALRGVLLRPRTFRWNVAQAIGVAAGLALLALWVRPGRQETLPAGPQAAAAAESESTVLVRFVHLDAGASSVSVAGDFNGWNPAGTPLRWAGGGAWAVTVSMKPGRYNYMYVVDGREWVKDPTAGETSLDGFGSENSVLNVES